MKRLFFIPMLVAILTSACIEIEDPDDYTNKITPATPIALTIEQESRVSQDNEFALNLLKQTITVSGEENVIVSPLSVSIALGIARNGANGQTKTEMEAALKMSDLSDETINSYYKIMQTTLPTIDPTTKVSIANSIWQKTGFSVKQDFLNINTDYFNAYIKTLDFSQVWAKDTINKWCARKTNNLIPTIIDNIPSDAVMYLINAVYFKGIWSNKFDTKQTVETNFTNELNQQNKVNMMNLTDTFRYAKDDMAQYIDLPYGNKAYSMTVILPLNGKSTTDVLNSLTSEKYNQIISSLLKKNVVFSMPRFKIGCKYLLNTELQNMGMNLAFDQNLADFSKISDLQQLYISRVIHKTQVEVNEEGTEAAAVTAVETTTTSIHIYEVMNVNKPYIFLIRERSTGVILFAAKIGHVTKY